LSDAHLRTPKLAPGMVDTQKDEIALSEDVDLDLEMRRHVLDTHRALDRLHHYALLGVEQAADKKELKRAYYELAAKFHPDRYFRKRLGSFKLRMETIFGRLTIAHDTLSNRESRVEYDAYLAEQRRAQGIEELLAEAAAEARRAEESIEREVRGHSPLAVPASSVPPPQVPFEVASPRVPPPQAAPPQVPPPQAPPAPGPSVDLAARRDALAKRLLGGRAVASSSAPPARISLAPPPPPNVADAMDALRRRYEERVLRAKAVQARRYAANAESALAKGDTVAAARAFRVALSLSPGDAELERTAQDAQAKADAVLGETYARQAAYEEKTDHWREAARSWTRVCQVRPNDADAHEHAANALVKASGDLHEAGRHAERACALMPQTSRYRVALANVYLAAGLSLNARRELELAAQLAPHDGTIQAMVDRVGGLVVSEEGMGGWRR
jgi:tetratricopeptide (TPR) repeat protein